MPDSKFVDRRRWAGGEDAPVSEPQLKPKYVEELEATIAEKNLEIQQLLAKYRGASEEFEQARARLRKEVTKDVERGRRTTLTSFLEILDNLDRALEAAPAPDDPFVKGVALVRQQFLSTLEGFGVTRVEAIGQTFDPSLHEAVSTITASTPDDEGKIVGVVRPGYLIGEDVLRPAQVAVMRFSSIPA